MNAPDGHAAVAVNASNVHYGGALQVAVSFIAEYVASNISIESLHLYVSSEIKASLDSLRVDLAKFEKVIVLDSRARPKSAVSAWIRFREYRTIFTVFGPFYGPKLPGYHIQGFGQAWILQQDNDAARMESVVTRCWLRLKYGLQKRLFGLADALVVESDRARTLMANDSLLGSRRIEVVSNAISSVFLATSPKSDHRGGTQATSLVIGTLCRDYPHKNLAYLVRIKQLLEGGLGIHVEARVTLTATEWTNHDATFQSALTNIGPVSLLDAPDFYKGLDMVVFSSLLETFSATPIEALAMKIPLFASDRHFVRDFCGDHAVYIDPLDAKDGADQIMSYWRARAGGVAEQRALEDARAFVLNQYSPQARMQQYVNCIERSLLPE